ncbi:CvpA family protein [Cytophagales bacterium LB-30]|uniref:CvpA family protein n=1 Tax=Shiella aurantiaca TaxID=3058365 RepID=A0ABT8F2E9_9BACT|nr:CvpA family protein [Shiella aurantiaca]MDN4164585.1 CvpA family protein [Shiella aurantiaca]
MNTFDIILLVLLGIGAFMGFRKGLIMEVISLLAIILAIVGSFKLLHWGMAFIQEKTGYFDSLLPFIAFVLLFIGILVLVNLLGKAVKKIIDLTPFGLIDNMVGALLGIFKWGLALSVIVWLASSASVEIPENFTQDSFLYPYLLAFAPKVIGFFSGLMPYANDLVESIKELLSGVSH